MDTSTLYTQENNRKKKCIFLLQTYIHTKASDNVNTRTFSFNGAKNTRPDTVDWTLTPPARENIDSESSKFEHHHT